MNWFLVSILVAISPLLLVILWLVLHIPLFMIRVLFQCYWLIFLERFIRLFNLIKLREFIDWQFTIDSDGPHHLVPRSLTEVLITDWNPSITSLFPPKKKSTNTKSVKYYYHPENGKYVSQEEYDKYLDKEFDKRMRDKHLRGFNKKLDELIDE